MYERKQLPLTTCEKHLQKKPGLCGRPATHVVLFWNENQADPELWYCLYMCSLHLTWMRKDRDRAVRTIPLSAIDYAYTPPHLEVFLHGSEPK